MSSKAVIFDFDGTIADSRDYFVDFLAKEAGITNLNAAKRREVEGMSLRRMALKLGNPRWRLLSLYFKGRKQMKQVMPDLPPFKGMPELIKQLHADGYQLFIVSWNSQANIRSFLHREGINDEFTRVRAGVAVFGKAPVLRKLIKHWNIDGTQSFYIGDELRDMQAAKLAGLQGIAVTWGFAKAAYLKPFADHLVHTPKELAEVIAKQSAEGDD